MNDTFSLTSYAEELFKELVITFKQASTLATHPGAVGSGKEKSAIEKLQLLLPEGVGVGSGFVYDQDGNVSGQCDIVLYEKDYCLRAIINGDEGNAYYNCESVIAVGEIKSRLQRAEFEDCLSKFERLSRLKRGGFEKPIRRQFLSKTTRTSWAAYPEGLDHIFKFIISEKVEMSPNLICDVIAKTKPERTSLPNELLDLNGFSIGYLDGAQVTFLPAPADLILFQDDKCSSDAFSRFFYHLISFIENGLTVPLNYESYYREKARISPKWNAPLAKIYADPQTEDDAS